MPVVTSGKPTSDSDDSASGESADSGKSGDSGDAWTTFAMSEYYFSRGVSLHYRGAVVST
jgi:hypothetical protein